MEVGCPGGAQGLQPQSHPKAEAHPSTQYHLQPSHEPPMPSQRDLRDRD